MTPTHVTSELKLRARLAVDLLEGIKRAGDFSARALRVHPALLGDERELAVELWCAHRVAGLVIRIYSEQSMLLALGEAGLEKVRGLALSYQQRAFSLQRALRDLLEAAQQADLWMMPIKGIMDAQDLFGDIGTRACNDVDVIVKPKQLEAASRVLRSLGYTETAPYVELGTTARHWWRSSDHAIEWKNTGTGVFVDLHWRLNDVAIVKLDHDGWIQASQPATCWGIQCQRLPALERYIAILTHTSRTMWTSLRSWADLVRARELASRAIDEREFAARLQFYGASELDEQLRQALVDLAHACTELPRPDSPASWMLRQRAMMPLETLRRALAQGYGWRYFALVVRKDMVRMEIPTSMLPLYLVVRPSLVGWRKLRRYVDRLRAR